MFNVTLLYWFSDDNLLFYIFRNSKFDLKENLSIKKLECLHIYKFLRFKMIWSLSFEKKYLGGQILYRSFDPKKSVPVSISLGIRGHMAVYIIPMYNYPANWLYVDQAFLIAKFFFLFPYFCFCIGTPFLLKWRFKFLKNGGAN